MRRYSNKSLSGALPRPYRAHRASGRLTAGGLLPRRRQFEAGKTSKRNVRQHVAILPVGLSPSLHPAMGGVLLEYEPMGLGEATGWGAEPSKAQRPAPLRPGSVAFGVFSRSEIAQGAVRSGVVVVIFPGRQHGSSLCERSEQCLIEKFVAQARVETLDEGILSRFAGRDVVPVDLPFLAESAARPCRSARCRCRTGTTPAGHARR